MLLLLLAGLAPSLALLATGMVVDLATTQDHLIGMPISRRIHANDISDFTKRDREYRKRVKRDGHQCLSSIVKKTLSTPLDDIEHGYAVTIGVGDPPTECES